MDNRREKILVSLAIFMVLKYVIISIMAVQKTIIYQHNAAIMMMAYFLFGSNERVVWKFDRPTGYVSQFLLGSYSARMFQDRLRVSRPTFTYLCHLLGPFLSKKDTKFRTCIPLEVQIAITLHRLGSGDALHTLADLYGISKPSASIIVRKTCEGIKRLLRPLVFQRPTLGRMKQIATEFESLHGIPYILGAIDGSHIPIIAPSIDPASYYCRKRFYSVLLQGVVDYQCKFWDYDFGWAGSIHDWSLFQKSEIGKRTMSGAFLPYKFIGDAAYPMRPWFYSPFKGEKMGLSKEKQYWNFIQSSTRMAVERAFGILKGRWRMLLKRIDMPLQNIPDIITACLCLHNLCIIHGDEFDLN